MTPSSPAYGDARRPSALRWILPLALAARLAMVAYAAVSPARFDYPDTRRYVAVARNIAAGLGPVESNHGRCGTDPLYPLFLSIAPTLGASSNGAILLCGRAVNVILGLACVIAVYRIADRLGGTRAAIVAALILSLDPITLFFHGLVLTEVAYSAALLWTIDRLLAARQDGRILPVCLAGLCLGLGAITRSSGLLLPIALLPALLIGRARPARRALLACGFLFAFALPIAPVAARNYRLLGHWVPVRTGSGATLLESLGPWADGGPGMEKVVWPAFPPDANEAVRDRVCREAAIAWARSHPAVTLRLAWVKLRRTWSITLHAPGYQGDAFTAIGWLTVAPVYLLALVGIWTLRRRRDALWLLLAAPLYFSVLHSIFVGSVRYRVPVMPFLMILAGIAIAHVTTRRAAPPGPADEQDR